MTQDQRLAVWLVCGAIFGVGAHILWENHKATQARTPFEVGRRVTVRFGGTSYLARILRYDIAPAGGFIYEVGGVDPSWPFPTPSVVIPESDIVG